MRVVSIVPSATETLRALDQGSKLVGQTSHDQADAAVVGGWLTPDLDTIVALEPDVVLAVDALQDAIVDRLSDRGLEVVHVTPGTLGEVFDAIVTLGTAVDARVAAKDLGTSLRKRCNRVADRAPSSDRPVVYCEEWSDPPMVAGNWVPDMVETAGGTYPFVSPGDRSRRVDRATVEAAAPTYVVLHPCGRGVDTDPHTFADRGWSVPALETNRVVAVDDALFNRPGPSLVNGIEWLAALLDSRQ